ncbi:uncharacterized protein LOC119448047 [Dermacentor silvarum]|uniref:uncharacterized protein LOC119448047 n=1 Tax=Dermacentor silvarum TaxID=543639 RepID=UPI00189A75BE|nr:uncharacterized protein LOC119448047 [Dermacentor silvarum]
MGISAGNLADLLAGQFAARPPALQAPPPEAATLSIPSSCHHADWVAAQIQALCSEPIHMYDLKAALHQTRRCSAPGADRITFQMLRNLADAEKERLLECVNTIWDTGVLPESWLVAVVTPILKSRKPVKALYSYSRRGSGANAARQTISDVVATLEDAKAMRDVAMLVLLDVQSAFDGLARAVIEACLDRLGLSGCLRSFISAFLTGRPFRIRLGQELSEPRDITTGVPQGSRLSRLLFHMAVAGLPTSLPVDPWFPVRCSIYADDVALWTRGPRKSTPSIRCSLQRALDAVTTFLGSIGLTVSTAKTEAMLVHPLASAQSYTKQLKISGRALPWKQMVTYLGLAIDHRITRIPAAKAATTKVRRVQGAVSKLQQQQGRGCSPKWALRLNQAAATSMLFLRIRALRSLSEFVESNEIPAHR